MANIDNIILGVDASNPHNSLEKWVAKINGTYDGDIPEPTSDIEKTLKKYYEEGGHGSSAEWDNKLSIFNNTTSGMNIAVSYIAPSGLWEYMPINEGDTIEIPFTALADRGDPAGFIIINYDGVTIPVITTYGPDAARGNYTILSSGAGDIVARVKFQNGSSPMIVVADSIPNTH